MTIPESVRKDENINRDEILNLHTHYESVIKDELEFFFKYLNFYIGLLSALLAGTLTGMLNIKETTHKYFECMLLLGPCLIIALSLIAYKFILVYYRRFLEAVVTVFNIKTMLKYREKVALGDDIIDAPFPSKFGGGFITQFNRRSTRKILEYGIEKNLPAEDVLEKLLKNNDTLNYAKVTLSLFALSAGILLVVLILKLNGSS